MKLLVPNSKKGYANSEYALIIVLAILVTVGTLSYLGDSQTNILRDVGSALPHENDTAAAATGGMSEPTTTTTIR